MNAKQIANEILDEIGGKKNIESVTHCITRLRFVLKDTSIPNKEVVSNIDSVISVVEQGGQYQVVLGNKVNDVYAEVINQIGEEQTIVASTETKKKPLLDVFTATVSGIFMPVLGAMAASGTIKGILTVLSVANILPATSGTYITLYALSNSFFYFMPVILGASAAKYFKMNIYVGMLIGASLIYPTLIPYASKGSLTFLSIPVSMMDYTSTVFPAIVAVWLASKLDKLTLKLPLKDLRFILQPLIVLVISVPIALIVIGPIISTLGEILAQAVNAVYNFNPILGGAVIGGPWILMVMFGLHWAFIPIFINNVASQGFDPIMGLLLANQFAMAGAVFAVGIRTKKEKVRALSYSTGVTTLIGISEPALYGVLLPYKKPLISAIIGGSLGAMVAGALNTVQYTFGGSGLLGIPLIINPKGIDGGFYGGIASQIIGFAVAFAVTLLWGFKEEPEKVVDTSKESSDTLIDLTTILSGTVVPLSEVPDKVFSEGLMGQGLAVIPDKGEVKAPFAGTVTTVFPTKHAIGLTSDDGIELLIHIGLDTVELGGKGFTTYVETGQRVKKGDKLVEVDLESLKAANYATISPIIITNSADFRSVTTEQHKLHVLS